MMGDGLGISTLTAARIYLAQTRNLTGEAAALSWENMPNAALSKVSLQIAIHVVYTFVQCYMAILTDDYESTTFITEQTYSVDHQTAESAATATALLCGEKTMNSIVACNQQAVYEDCSTAAGNEIPSILTHALNAGQIYQYSE